MLKSEAELLLGGKRLITCEVTYHMPDYPRVLNTFVFQDYDLAPKFPRMFRFLDFWEREIDGRIHSVRFDHNDIAHVAAQEWRHAVSVSLLN